MLRRVLLSLMILKSNCWPEELIEVLHLPDVDLRAGQKGLDPEQVDDDTALDPSRQLSLHRRAGIVGVLDFVPHAHEVGFLLREHDPALEVFDVLEENLDFVAYGDRLRIGELPDRNGAFRLEADIDQHLLRVDADDAALDDFPFVLAGKALFVHRRELLHLLVGVLRRIEILDPDVSVLRFFGAAGIFFHGNRRCFVGHDVSVSFRFPEFS